jgi:Rrf2 family protein
MKITTAADYGIRALVYLAGQDRERVCLVSEISRAQDIPEKYLAKIMQSLAKSGLVKSLRGVKGGFVLARNPEDMSIRDALESIQGPVSLHKCIDEPETCGYSDNCGVRPVWLAAQEKMLEALSSASLKSVVETSISNSPQ